MLGLYAAIFSKDMLGGHNFSMVEATELAFNGLPQEDVAKTCGFFVSGRKAALLRERFWLWEPSEKSFQIGFFRHANKTFDLTHVARL